MPTAGSPVKIASASTGELVPQPGSTITTNVYGTDTLPLIYVFGNQQQAMSNRPARGTSYSGPWPLSDFKVHDTTVEFIEGQAVRMTVIYKRPNLTLGSFFELSSDLNPVVVTNAIVGIGADPTAIDFFSLSFPEPLITRRYVTTSTPQILALGTAYLSYSAAQALGFPPLNTVHSMVTLYYTDSTFTTQTKSVTNFYRVYDLNFGPNPFGWKNSKYGFTAWCTPFGQANAYFYEVTEVWRTFYAFTAATLISEHR